MGNVSFDSKSSKKNGDSSAFEGLGMLLPVLMGIVILVNGILVFVRKEEEINFALTGIWKTVYNILFFVFILICVGVFYGSDTNKKKTGMTVFLVILLLQGATIGILLAVNKSVAVANTVIDIIKWLDQFEGSFNILFYGFAILFVVAFFGSIIMLLKEGSTRTLILFWLGALVASYMVLFVIFMIVKHRILSIVLLIIAAIIALFVWIASKVHSSAASPSSGSRGPNSASTFDIDPKAMQRKIDDLKRDVAIDEKKLEKLG